MHIIYLTTVKKFIAISFLIVILLTKNTLTTQNHKKNIFHCHMMTID